MNTHETCINPTFPNCFIHDKHPITSASLITAEPCPFFSSSKIGIAQPAKNMIN
jgi:hypothetical protein